MAKKSVKKTRRQKSTVKKRNKEKKRITFRFDNRNAEQFFLMLFMILIIAIFGYYAIKSGEGQIWDYTLYNSYDLIIYSVIILGLLVVVFRRWFPDHYLKYKTMLAFLVLFPVVALPVFRCYYKIPFIFCRNCPTPCIFGFTRKYNFSGIFLVNLREKHFCKYMCPFGQIQDAAGSLFPRKLNIPRVFKLIRWVLFIAIVAVVLITVIGMETAWLGVEANFWYLRNIIVVGVMFGFILLSYFVDRAFCEYCCPVGSVGDMMLWAERKVWRKKYKGRKGKVSKKS